MKTIGIPRGLLYYRYGKLWEYFFSSLGFQIIISRLSDNEILKKGKEDVIDETCLAIKLYFGHVKSLIDKCDYILIPRFDSIKKKEKLCVNFLALYDIIKNKYPNLKIITYNVDLNKLDTEFYGLKKIANQLNCSFINIIKSYNYAINEINKEQEKEIKYQEILLKRLGTKILLIGHSYNIYDELIGKKIINYLNKEKISVIYPLNNKLNNNLSHQIAKTIYWTLNKELMANLIHYKDQVDGIVLISSFPCGSDALANEIIIHKIKNIPLINIIIDELDDDAGLITRLESFIDIIQMKKKGILNEK